MRPQGIATNYIKSIKIFFIKLIFKGHQLGDVVLRQLHHPVGHRLEDRGCPQLVQRQPWPRDDCRDRLRLRIHLPVHERRIRLHHKGQGSSNYSQAALLSH